MVAFGHCNKERVGFHQIDQMGKKMFREEETPPYTAQKGRTYAGPSTWCRAGGAQDALTKLSSEAGGIGGGPRHQEPRVPLYHSRTFLPQVKKDPIPTSLSKNRNNKKDPGVGFRHSWIQGSDNIRSSSQPSAGLA